jgi:hypothetical protein
MATIDGRKAARRLGVQSALRERGRPRKKRQDMENKNKLLT